MVYRLGYCYRPCYNISKSVSNVLMLHALLKDGESHFVVVGEELIGKALPLCNFLQVYIVVIDGELQGNGMYPGTPTHDIHT